MVKKQPLHSDNPNFHRSSCDERNLAWPDWPRAIDLNRVGDWYDMWWYDDMICWHLSSIIYPPMAVGESLVLHQGFLLRAAALLGRLRTTGKIVKVCSFPKASQRQLLCLLLGTSCQTCFVPGSSSTGPLKGPGSNSAFTQCLRKQMVPLNFSTSVHSTLTMSKTWMGTNK